MPQNSQLISSADSSPWVPFQHTIGVPAPNSPATYTVPSGLMLHVYAVNVQISSRSKLPTYPYVTRYTGAIETDRSQSPEVCIGRVPFFIHFLQSYPTVTNIKGEDYQLVPLASNLWLMPNDILYISAVNPLPNFRLAFTRFAAKAYIL